MAKKREKKKKDTRNTLEKVRDFLKSISSEETSNISETSEFSSASDTSSEEQRTASCNEGACWYSIRCISGKEGVVKKRIEAEVEQLGMQDAVEDIRIPTVNSYRTHKGKRKLYEKILMPGYVFLKARLTPELVHAINSLMDVIGFIGSKDKMPVPMREDEVRKILSVGVITSDLEETSFVVGEAVKITDGPFEGFDGKVEEVDSKRQRLRVIINIFGRETPVEINYIQAEKINN